MVSEDFSFPKITNPAAQFTFSPTLWRVSSLVFPSFDGNLFGDGEREADLGRNSSFSRPESGSDQEDKMDLLWEDFNDKELQRVCSEERSNNGEIKAEEDLKKRDTNTNSNDNMVEICCVEALKISKRGAGGGGGIIQHHRHQHKRKSNMGVFAKFLIRKILSINSKKSSTRLNNYCVWAPQSGI